MVVNARDMKNVPGRKKDVKDAEWIADLLQHGLLRTSYMANLTEALVDEAVEIIADVLASPIAL